MARTAARVLGAVAALVAGLAAAGAAAADAARGGALYETRCVHCHDRSVHARNPRAARSFDEIRQWVARWDRETGGAWTPADIDDVSRFLNERYYRYECPVAVCGRDRVRIEPPALAARR